MKAEGYQFPALKESDAMFRADTAPAWADGEVCHRCRVTFSMVQRKHHCRACGQVFCGQCSSKVSTLPKFGIEKEVRVCEACYEQVNKLVKFCISCICILYYVEIFLKLQFFSGHLQHKPKIQIFQQNISKVLWLSSNKYVYLHFIDINNNILKIYSIKKLRTFNF